MTLENFRAVNLKVDRANGSFLSDQFAKAGDYNGRRLVVQLSNAGVVGDLTGVDVNLGWQHDSLKNTGLDPFEPVDLSQGIFEIYYPKEMLNEGNVTALIQIIEGGHITETKNFKIKVEKSVIDEDTAVSENSFTVLEKALLTVNRYDSRISNVENTKVDKSTYEQNKNEVAAQLQHITYDMSGLNADGVTDDSAYIQSVLNEAENHKVKKIVFPKSNYRINTPLFAKGDDLELDFSGSTILSYVDATASWGGELGILNFHGKMVDGDILSYIRSIQKLPPISAPQLLTFESIKVRESGTLTTFVGGKITTSNNSFFNIGEEILIRGWTNTNGTNNYNKNLYQPEISVLAKVIKKDATHIYVDYYSPYTYPAFVQSVNAKSSVMKVVTQKNIKLKNVHIIDKSSVESTNGIPTSSDRLKTVCPVSTILCDGVSLENVSVEGHRGNGYLPYFTRNIKVENFEANNARLWDGGLGYGIQFNGCRQIEVNRVRGNGCRHIIDLSWSSYADINDVKGINSKSSDLDFHGLCEHDITLRNCDGYLAMGNGIIYFPNIVKNIQLIDCNIEMYSLIGNAVVDDRFVDNILIRGGKLKICHIPPFLNFTIDNVDIDWEVNEFSSATVNKRSQKINVIHSIKNSRVHLTNNGTVYDLYLANPDKTLIDNVIFSFANGYAFTPVGGRMTNQGGSLEIRNSDLDRIGIRYNATMPSSYLVLDNNKAKYINEGHFVTFHNIENSLLKIKIKGNIVEHLGSAPQFFALNGESVGMINSKIIGTFEGNTFIGNPNAKVHYIHLGVKDPAKATIYIHDSDNVIEHKDIAASVMFDNVRNLIIS